MAAINRTSKFCLWPRRTARRARAPTRTCSNTRLLPTRQAPPSRWTARSVLSRWLCKTVCHTPKVVQVWRRGTRAVCGRSSNMNLATNSSSTKHNLSVGHHAEHWPGERGYRNEQTCCSEDGCKKKSSMATAVAAAGRPPACFLAAGAIPVNSVPGRFRDPKRGCAGAAPSKSWSGSLPLELLPSDRRPTGRQRWPLPGWVGAQRAPTLSMLRALRRWSSLPGFEINSLHTAGNSSRFLAHSTATVLGCCIRAFALVQVCSRNQS